MDQTDIEVVKAVFSAFAARDVDGVLAHAADDIIFSPVTADRLVAGSTGWIWRLHEGKIVYGRVYPSAGAAIAALKDSEA